MVIIDNRAFKNWHKIEINYDEDRSFFIKVWYTELFDRFSVNLSDVSKEDNDALFEQICIELRANLLRELYSDGRLNCIQTDRISRNYKEISKKYRASISR